MTVKIYMKEDNNDMRVVDTNNYSYIETFEDGSFVLKHKNGQNYVYPAPFKMEFGPFEDVPESLGTSDD